MSAVIERQLGRQLPLVLKIGAEAGCGLAAIVDDRDRLTRLIAIAVDRKDLGRRVCGRAVARDQHPATQGLRIAQMIARIDLPADREVLLIGLLRLAVVEQLTQHIRAVA